MACLIIQGTVISLRMKKTEMGDRGSKLDPVCKRATSRRFFSITKYINSFNYTVRCTLVAGKLVFS